MCIEARARRLLCGIKIKYLPLHEVSGEDDKPSLNPTVEKHRKNYFLLQLFFMSINFKPEIFYVQPMASESDAGYIFLPADQYVDPIILNEILEANNSFPCNATGKMEVWTTIPDLQPKSEWESINYVSDEDLKEWECDSLFDSLITGDYEMGSHWNPCFLSVTWGDGDQEDVEKAIANYLDAAPSQADVDEYKRLKAKLGL